MANNKVITPEGKTEMLRLALLGNDGFGYLALGDENSDAAQGGTFSELTGNNYHRETLSLDGDIDPSSQSITLSAIFDDTNYNPANGGTVKEIGIVNTGEDSDNNQTWFAYAEIPEITKSDNISLKYTIVISVL